MLNCWVTETKDTPCVIEQLDDLGEVGQRAGEAIHLVDDDHVDLASPGCPSEAAAGQDDRLIRPRTLRHHIASRTASSQHGLWLLI